MERSLTALLAEGLTEVGFDARPAQRDPLVTLSELLAVWGQRINLTGHRTPEEILRRLVLDAAALSRQLPPLRSLADVGSGAGFPGLPLAVLDPELRVTLVEVRARRHHFQRAAIRALGLENAIAVLGRAEEIEARPHEAAIAQALAKPALAVARLLPWVEPGGWILLPGGESPPEVPARPGVEHVRSVAYQVPLDGPRRTLWLGRARTRD